MMLWLWHLYEYIMHNFGLVRWTSLDSEILPLCRGFPHDDITDMVKTDNVVFVEVIGFY